MTTSIFEKRLSYKPFDYSEITDPLINAMWASHWTHNEFNFKADVQDYHTSLTKEERDVIKRAILLISQVEVAVKSYWSNIGKHLPKPEISDMGAVFGGVEVIHSRAYSEILTKLGLEDAPSPSFAVLVSNTVSLVIACAAFRIEGRQIAGSAKSIRWFIASGVAAAVSLHFLNSALQIGNLVEVVPIVSATPVFTVRWYRCCPGLTM